jgi:DNA-binding response OmpR family regulator
MKKPIDLDELLSRIKALLKRTNHTHESVKIGECIYHPKEKKLICKDSELSLSKKLSELLELLLEQKNQLVTKEYICQRLWEWDKQPSEGSLRVYINELKKLIGKEMITNQKGIGYKLEL